MTHPIINSIMKIPLIGDIISTKKSIEKIERMLIKQTPMLTLHQFELHLTDHCNLNCRGCNHFSPLAPKKFADIDSVEKDFKRISELFNKKVGKIILLGGEPLLHPKINDFIILTRKYFPDTEINIITNGILLKTQKDEFWSVCRENKVIIEATKYPLKIDWKEIIKKANENNVKFIFAGDTDKTLKTLSLYPLDLSGMQNEAENYYLNCDVGGKCVYLSDGVIYPCPIAPNITHFNKYFGLNIPITDKDGINIYNVKDGKEILEFLTKPVPICKYCMINARIDGIKWSRSQKEITEWTIK